MKESKYCQILRTNEKNPGLCIFEIMIHIFWEIMSHFFIILKNLTTSTFFLNRSFTNKAILN